MPIYFARCFGVWLSLPVGQYSIQVSSPKWYLNLWWLKKSENVALTTRPANFFINQTQCHTFYQSLEGFWFGPWSGMSCLFKFQNISTERMSQKWSHVSFYIWIRAWKQTQTQSVEDKASARERSQSRVIENGNPYLPSALAQLSCYRCPHAMRSPFPTHWFYKLQDKCVTWSSIHNSSTGKNSLAKNKTLGK